MSARLPPDSQFPTADDKSVELSSRRTGMSFQRTRLSAERTLMSVIRTSLSLISFGFTIYQVFSNALKIQGITLSAHAPRNFGIALVALGVLMLFFGMAYHIKFMVGLRTERAMLKGEGLVHAQSAYPVSLTMITAAILFCIGLVAFASMVFDITPHL